LSVATQHHRRALASTTAFNYCYWRASQFLPLGSKIFFDGISPPLAAAANSDTPAVITLNPKKHIAHHLSLLANIRNLASVVAELMD
jgi:hypothetical protein